MFEDDPESQRLAFKVLVSGFGGSLEKISGDRLHQDHQVKPSACLKCYQACGE